MLGSAVQTRRNAARVSAGGTPGARKARIFVSAVIESIGGRAAGSNGGAAGSGPPGPGMSPSFGRAGRGDPAPDSRAPARFRRDQRNRKLSGSLIRVGARRAGRAPTKP